MKRVFTCLMVLLYALPLTAQQKLNRVTVTADRLRTDRFHTESRTTISREEIRKSGARNLPDLLETREGIQIERYGGQGQLASIRIRGSAPSQVLVLIDGVPANSGLGGGADLGSLNLNTIEKIEVIRGGASALLGGGAFAGAVLITTRPDRRSNGGSIDLSWGSFKTWGANGLLKIRSKNSLLPSLHTSLSLSGSEGGYLFPGQLALSGDGGYTLGGDPVRHRNSGFTAGTGNAILSWGGTNLLSADLNIRYSDREAGVPGTIDFPTVDATQRDRRMLLSFTGQHRRPGLISGDRLRLRLFYQQQKRFYRDFSLFNTEQHHNLKKGGLRLHYSAGTDTIRWKTGIAVEEERMLSDSLSANELSRSVFSLWSGLLGNPLPRLVLKGNVRLDRADGFETAVSPKAGAAYRIAGEKLVLKANIGQSYRLPSYSDLFWPDTFFAAGNPDLKPEISRNIDAGLEARPALWFSANLFLFHNRVKNLIRWEPSAGGVWRPSNLGKARIRGLEASVKIQKQFGFYLLQFTANYTLQQVTDRSGGSNDGNQLPRRPFEKAACSLIFTSGHGWHLKAEGDYLGFRYINAANTKYLGDYFLLHFSGGVEFKNGIRFRFSIRNIMDTPYIHIREYPVPGREFSVESGYRF